MAFQLPTRAKKIFFYWRLIGARAELIGAIINLMEYGTPLDTHTVSPELLQHIVRNDAISMSLGDAEHNLSSYKSC